VTVQQSATSPLSHNSLPPRDLLLLNDGDPKTFEEIIERYSGLVKSIVRRKKLPASEVEDATQDIWIAISKASSQFDPNRSTEAYFISMIATNKAIDRLRSLRARTKRTNLFDDLNTLPDSSARPRSSGPPDARGSCFFEQWSLVKDSFDKLTPRAREVITLRFECDLTERQIAKYLGIPIGTVKSNYTRGLGKLRDLMKSASNS